MKIKEIMRPVKSLPADASVSQAAAIMKDQDIDVIPVGGPDRLEGVVTSREIALATATGGCDPEQMSVDEVLNRVTCFCYEGEELSHALKTMQACHAHEVVVRDSMGRVVGVVAVTDILVALQVNGSADGSQEQQDEDGLNEATG